MIEDNYHKELSDNGKDSKKYRIMKSLILRERLEGLLSCKISHSPDDHGKNGCYKYPEAAGDAAYHNKSGSNYKICFIYLASYKVNGTDEHEKRDYRLYNVCSVVYEHNGAVLERARYHVVICEMQPQRQIKEYELCLQRKLKSVKELIENKYECTRKDDVGYTVSDKYILNNAVKKCSKRHR